MNRRTAIGITGALLVHLVALWLVLPKPIPPDPPPPPLTFVDLSNNGVDQLEETSPNGKGESCVHNSSTYTGIGILYQITKRNDQLIGIVLQVGKGSPADIAGIQAGDFVDVRLFETTLDVKHPVTFWVIHQGVRVNYTITPGLICYH